MRHRRGVLTWLAVPLLAGLLVATQSMNVVSYWQAQKDSARFHQATSVTSRMVDVNREASRLAAEIQRLTLGLGRIEPVALRRQLLDHQIQVTARAAAGDSGVLRRLGELYSALESLDLTIEQWLAEPTRRPALGATLRGRADEVERVSKMIYDASEVALFGSVQDGLDDRAHYRTVLAATTGLTLLLAGLLGLSVARGVRRSARANADQLRQEVAERRAAERRLEQLAYADPLTGLANRARLGLELDRLRGEGTLALLFVDLDRFKLVNDSMGHEAGDRLLVAVAERLRLAAPSDAHIARLGGDEFTVLLPRADTVTAGLVAAGLLEALSRPVDFENSSLTITASIGIATSLTSTRETLLRDADAALYLAKDSGRDRYEVFDVSLHADAVDRLGMQQRLREAVAEKAFRLHYQPIVSLDPASTSYGLEALLRWPTSDTTFISPDEFIPVAEETGLILPLGRWVLRTALTEVTEGIRVGRLPVDCTLSINVSPVQFRDRRLATQVRQALHDSGLPPDQLIIEVTEGAVMEDAHEAHQTLQSLRDIGVRVALDDFGTGYSSLSILRDLPVDILKVDRSLIVAIDDGDPVDRALVQSIVTLAHALDLAVTAEGVERAAQADVLRDLRVDSAQGYFWSRPTILRDLPYELTPTRSRPPLPRVASA